MNIRELQALWVLELLPAGELPGIGIEMLESGLDSVSLTKLACLLPCEAGEAESLFSKTLNELGLPCVGRVDALRTYASMVSMQILQKSITPIAGAKKIWDVSLRVEEPEVNELDEFVYAASEAQSRPSDLNFFENEIMRIAKEWASRREGGD